MDERTVWVVQQGVYEDRQVVKVCASLDLAKACDPTAAWSNDGGFWHNGQDWDDCMVITSIVVAE